MEKFELKNTKSQTLKTFLITNIDNMSNSLVNHMLKRKDVFINDKRVNQDCMLCGNETIKCYFQRPEKATYFDKIFEDQNVLIINKHCGIEVCDGENNVENILNNQKQIYSAVHRIDRNTEGLVIFAKNKNTKDVLDKAIKYKDEIEKIYLCEVLGCPKTQQFTATAHLVKDAKNNVVKIFAKPQKDSVEIKTQIETIEQREETTILKITLLTGKTHQIRAHLAYLGLPIIGDGKYGDYKANKKYNAKTQHLTAKQINFNLKDKNLSYLNKMDFTCKPSWLD